MSYDVRYDDDAYSYCYMCNRPMLQTWVCTHCCDTEFELAHLVIHSCSSSSLPSRTCSTDKWDVPDVYSRNINQELATFRERVIELYIDVGL